MSETREQRMARARAVVASLSKDDKVCVCEEPTNVSSGSRICGFEGLHASEVGVFIRPFRAGSAACFVRFGDKEVLCDGHNLEKVEDGAMTKAQLAARVVAAVKGVHKEHNDCWHYYADQERRDDCPTLGAALDVLADAYAAYAAAADDAAPDDEHDALAALADAVNTLAFAHDPEAGGAADSLRHLARRMREGIPSRMPATALTIKRVAAAYESLEAAATR